MGEVCELGGNEKLEKRLDDSSMLEGCVCISVL